MNPAIRHMFTCDPTALESNGTLFLYTGHDEPPVGVDDYVMNKWLVFSSVDLVHWTKYPVPLRATDFAWAKGDAYASKIFAWNQKFYWFVSVTHRHVEGKAIGVAVSTSPTGPFRDAIGSALITHDMLPIAKDEKANLDPSVIVDDKGEPYIFWGNGNCYFARLNNDLSALTSPITTIDLPGFSEGSHIHKRNGWYYFSYGYKMPEQVAYAMSRNVNGPWEFKGVINEPAFNCETNRPCIIDFKGKSYFIYHNGALPGGGSHRRSVCIDQLYYNSDGTIQKIKMTDQGVAAPGPESSSGHY